MADVTHIYGNEIVDAAARQDIADLETTTNTLKEDFHSYHSELGAGYADQIVSSIENTDSVPYNFRKVPYDATLEYVDAVVGGTVVLNQLVNMGTYPQSKTELGITFTKAGNAIVCNGTATGNALYIANYNINVTAGHVYFLGGCPSGGGHPSYRLVESLTGDTTFFDLGNGLILRHSKSGKAYVSPQIMNGATVSNLSFTMGLSDITAALGSTIADYVYNLETATAGAGVAWLKEHFPKIFNAGYIPYNTGELVSVGGVSEKKNVGFNQCAENWRQGDWNNASPKRVALVNTDRIPLIGGQTYYISCSSPNNSYRVSCAVLENIDSTSYFEAIGFSTGATYIASKNCYLAPVVMRSDDSAITPEEVKANCKVCINLSDPARNGEYEPYEEHTYPLDSSLTLRGIPKLDAQNNLYYDGDEYLSDGSVNRRYGVVDLGTLTWAYNSGNNRFDSAIVSASYTPQGQIVANAIASKYETVSFSKLYADTTFDKCLAFDKNNLRVRDLSYTDAASFKAAMSGVMLVYELATPTTEQAEPYRQKQICDPNGTEEFVSTTVVPVGHVTKYPLDIAGRLDNILSMPTADGTYVLRAVVSNGNVTYSWVSA